MNFENSASRWMDATAIYARVPTHTHTHTLTNTHTHACAYIHKQGVTLHILVCSISSEGVVYHHSDVSPDGTTARVHVTLWTDCIAMSMKCCKREPFISFNNIKCLSTNFVWVKNWIFLRKVLSIEIVIEKTAGKPRSGRIIKNRNCDSCRIYQNSNGDIKTYRNKLKGHW